MRLAAATTVADVAVTCPELHGPETTIAELRRLFLDDHVHMAVLVEEGRVVGAVERRDLDPALDGALPARLVGRLSGRVVSSDASAGETLERMRSRRRRRLVVTDGEGKLVGLLCLKASGQGFCSDDDVISRKLGLKRP